MIIMEENLGQELIVGNATIYCVCIECSSHADYKQASTCYKSNYAASTHVSAKEFNWGLNLL